MDIILEAGTIGPNPQSSNSKTRQVVLLYRSPSPLLTTIWYFYTRPNFRPTLWVRLNRPTGPLIPTPWYLYTDPMVPIYRPPGPLKPANWSVRTSHMVLLYQTNGPLYRPPGPLKPTYWSALTRQKQLKIVTSLATRTF